MIETAFVPASSQVSEEKDFSSLTTLLLSHDDGNMGILLSCLFLSFWQWIENGFE